MKKLKDIYLSLKRRNSESLNLLKSAIVSGLVHIPGIIITQDAKPCLHTEFIRELIADKNRTPKIDFVLKSSHHLHLI
jgi:hypothetical protein